MAFAEEVGEAMSKGIHLILAHEMEGFGEADRKGCKFELMFACEHGATPQELLQAGIYTDIAVGLKGCALGMLKLLRGRNPRLAERSERAAAEQQQRKRE